MFKTRRPLRVLASALSVAVALSACALHSASEKCGVHACPNDAKITADVLSQFKRQPDLEPNTISVQTLDHVVYLNGLVSSGLEADTADSIAAQVPGVTRVVSSIALTE